MTNALPIVIFILIGLIFFVMRRNDRLKQDLNTVKQERDDLILGFERMQQDVKKYQIIKEEAFSSDIDELLERMRKRGQVDES